jgi:hypothetical protein
MRTYTQIHFGTKVPREGVPIAHLEAPELLAQDAMVLFDRSGDIPQNNFFEQDIEINLVGKVLTYFLDKNGFLLTDKFNGSRPMYYKHVMQGEILVNSDGSADVSVTDGSGNQISSNFFIFDCGKGAVYHSLNPQRVFFVTFPKVDSEGNIIDSQHRELLESLPAFEEADHNDLMDAGCLNPDADAYIINELDGQPNFWRLTLPRPTVYSLRHTNEGLLNLILPPTIQSEPWYIEVNNAVLMTIHSKLTQLMRYTVAEFDIQSFYPFPPIKLVTDKKAMELADGVLALGTGRIVVTNKTPID